MAPATGISLPTPAPNSASGTCAYTPQTNGKAERLIQTLLREWAYLKRPHAGCGALTPMKKLERAA